MNQLEIEDFKFSLDRIKSYDNRFFQLVLYCFSSYGVGIGLIDTIPKHIIPIILSLILYVFTWFGVNCRMYLYKNAAYLLKQYYKKENNIFHESFYKYFVDRRKYSKYTLGNILKSSFIDPFTILLFVNSVLIICFDYKFIKDSIETNIIIAIICILYFVGITFFTCYFIYEKFKYDYEYFIKLYDEFYEKETKSNSI